MYRNDSTPSRPGNSGVAFRERIGDLRCVTGKRIGPVTIPMSSAVAARIMDPMRAPSVIGPTITLFGSCWRRQALHVLTLRLLIAIVSVSAVSLATARADDTDLSSDDMRFFESKIRPILVEHCYECHSIEAGVSESGLRLDTRNALREGGDRGAAVVAGKPKESLLLSAISHADPDLQMPPRDAPVVLQRLRRPGRRARAQGAVGAVEKAHARTLRRGVARRSASW